MTKIIDNTNLGYLISKIKAAFWPKTDVVQIGLDDTPIANSTNLVKSGGVKSALDAKQDTLVSGTNIKTINNESLLGSGNISITGGSGGEANVIEAVTFNGTPATITNKTAAITATIPDAQVQSDWNATSGMGVILNKPDVVQILGVYSVNAGKVFKATFHTLSFNPQLILVIHKDGNPDRMLSVAQYAYGDNYFVATDLTGACEYLYQDNGKAYLYQDGAFFGIRAGDSNIKIEVIALYNDLVGIEHYIEDWNSGWINSGYDPVEIQRLATVNQIPAAVTESTVAGWGFTKNAGTLTTETDPIFSASAAAGITASDITNWNGKTSNTGTVTGVKINGTTKNPTSGVVDLGTVLTSHQDISGKANLSGAAFTGTVTGTSSGNTAQFRNVTISSSEPTSSDGSNGDIWIVI